ncbi:MAG: LD-carboxypeptidase [Chitinophagaceae bacterium]|nr:MAG: LD-carboxypeptidase [Chitinophagaceae bacterium]
MQRKSFLGTCATLFAGSIAARGASVFLREGEPDARLRVPPYLKPGDTVGITSPAGAITEAELQPALQQLRAWGFSVRIGSSIGKKDFSFGGTDEERCSDLQQLLDDPGIAAILCARGGYGSARIVDALAWDGFRKHPKWLIGFSDITVLHAHIQRHCGVASIHSKMCNSFPDDWDKAEPIQRETVLSIRDALQGARVLLNAPANARNRPGSGEGMLIGGNLRTLENLAGTPSDIQTKGKILFIEDTGEYAYSIDRMLENLRRGGKLASLAGLVVGGFKIRPDDPGEEFGRTLADIIAEKTAGTRYPIGFDFPIGHQRANFALKCGLRHRLAVRIDGSSLTELQ